MYTDPSCKGQILSMTYPSPRQLNLYATLTKPLCY